jgi:hypothetical protein
MADKTQKPRNGKLKIPLPMKEAMTALAKTPPMAKRKK